VPSSPLAASAPCDGGAEEAPEEEAEEEEEEGFGAVVPDAATDGVALVSAGGGPGDFEGDGRGSVVADSVRPGDEGGFADSPRLGERVGPESDAVRDGSVAVRDPAAPGVLPEPPPPQDVTEGTSDSTRRRPRRTTGRGRDRRVIRPPCIRRI